MTFLGSDLKRKVVKTKKIERDETGLVVNTFLLVRCGGGCWSLVTTYVRIIGPI